MKLSKNTRFAAAACRWILVLVAVGAADSAIAQLPGPFTATATPVCLDGSYQVTLTWTPSAGAESYSVQRISSDPPISISYGPLPASQLSLTEVVDSGTNYMAWMYAVNAVNASGESHAYPPFDALYAGVCQPPPDAPQVSLSGTCDNATSIVHVMWTPVPGAVSYTVLQDGLTKATGLSPSLQAYDDVLSTSYNEVRLANYAVRAILTGRTVTSADARQAFECFSPPLVLTATVTSCDGGVNHATVHLSWPIQPVAPFAFTIVGRYTDGNSDGQLGSVRGQVGTYDDTTATPGHTYTYNVFVDGYPTSLPASVTTCLSVPSLTASSECNGPVTFAHLTWSASAGATSYTVLRNGSPIGSATSTSFDDTNVLPNQSYVYLVHATGPGGSVDSAGVPLTLVPCATAHVDLRVSDVTITPSTIVQGDLLTIAFSVANIGQSAAAATITRLRLGSGLDQQPGDVALVTVATPPLAAGATISQSVATAVLAPFADATFYVFVSADDTHVTDDVNATNSTARSAALQVFSPPPCVLSCKVSGPASGTVRQPVTLLTAASCPDSTVTWDFGDTTTITGSSVVNHSYEQPGTYHWTVRVTAGVQTCEESGTIEIAEQPAPPKRRSVRH